MSAELAKIPKSTPNTYGPLLCSIDEQQFKFTCILLSTLPIPVRFVAPEEICNADNFYNGLLLLGKDIEEDLIKLEDGARQNNLYAYIFCINIHCEITSQEDDQFVNCSYHWDAFLFHTRHYHGPQMLDLSGHTFYNLTELLQKNQKLGH